jgi:hypothetical protein
MNRTTFLLLSVIIAVALLSLLLLANSVWARPALTHSTKVPLVHNQDVLCVNPGGTGGCYASVQSAVDAADDGDTIRVAEGTYFETIKLTKSLTLEGGWNTGLTARDWKLYVTTIDAQRNGPVIWVNAALTPTIEGFVLTNGDDTDHLGWGGGIKIYWSGHSDREGHTTIRHNVITDNVACTADTCQGYGGGILVHRSSALIESNTIVSNTARTAGAGSGHGGGVVIWTSSAILRNNHILSNTAILSTTGLTSGQGGGVDSQHAVELLLEGNEIRGNVAAVRGPGYGGGVYANATLVGNHILSNTASITGTGYGGGVYAYYVIDFDDNLVQGNIASASGDGIGGGLYALYLGRATRNKIIDNVARRGGGIYMTAYVGKQILRDNFVAHNQATGADFAAPDGGGGIASEADWVEITGNKIVSNTAETTNGTGGGVQIAGGTRYRLVNNRIAGNTAAGGGGLAVYTATGTIAHNHVFSNLALLGGGMYFWGAASPALDSNYVTSNTALGFFAAGGGLLVNLDAGTPLTVTNHLIARNAAGPSGQGGGVLCGGGDCILLNNTIVDNDRGDYKEGVLLAGGGKHQAHNNLIVGHSLGISLTDGTLALDYNNYYDNDVDVSGATWGAHHRTDDPQFENRDTGDYHLSLSSPLIDQGKNIVAVSYDFEGDPRPRGTAWDIGADEVYPAETYVSAISGNDLTGSGSQIAPFATLTKGLSETGTGGTIYVGRGHYTERITVTRSVRLLGGHHEADWTRDIPLYTSTLDSQETGTVVFFQGKAVQALLEGFTITGGEASYYGSGGGILVKEAAVTIRHNHITGNHAQNGGGGLLVLSEPGNETIIESNHIYNNIADGIFPSPRLRLPGSTVPGQPSSHPPRLMPATPQQGPEPGGGLLVFDGPVSIANNFVYSNTGAAGGDGLALIGWDAPVELRHNTIIDNNGSAGVGVEVRGEQVLLYNNLIVGHRTGITSSIPMSWDYNGFYDNTTNYAPGLTGGHHDLQGDPHFANRSQADYHIGPGSAMAGHGLDVKINSDIDGDTRPAPLGTQPDIGADEVAQRYLYLPLLLR